jgi:hypothetical protein
VHLLARVSDRTLHCVFHLPPHSLRPVFPPFSCPPQLQNLLPPSPCSATAAGEDTLRESEEREGGWGPGTYRCLASSSSSSAKVRHPSPIDRFLTDLLPPPPVSSLDSLSLLVQTATGGRRRPGSSRPPTSGTSATSRVSPARPCLPIPLCSSPLARSAGSDPAADYRRRTATGCRFRFRFKL